MKKFLLFFLLIGNIFAGKYVADYLDFGVGARALGMGGGFVALADDATATYWNPAGILKVQTRQLSLMHTALYDNWYKYDSAYYRHPLGKSALGIGLVMLVSEGIPFTKPASFIDWGIDHIPSTGDTGEGNGVWDPGEQVIYDVEMKNDSKNFLNIGFAYPLSDLTNIGIGSKIIYENIGGYKAYGFGFDIGLTHLIRNDFYFGATLQDIPGTYLHWSTGNRENRTPTVKTGIAKGFVLHRIRTRLNTTIDIDTKFSNIRQGSTLNIGSVSFDPRIGVEAWIMKFLSIRSGLERKNITLGAGLKISYFELDYAFVGYELGNTHRVSLSFDIPSFERRGITTSKLPPQVAEQKLEKVKPEEEIQTISGEKETIRVSQPQPPAKPEPVTVESQNLDGVQVIPCWFSPGDASIRPEYFDTLNAIGKFLKENKNYYVILIGHTDNVPIKKRYKNNYELSLARAEAVAQYLKNNFGIEQYRLVTKGYGQDKPIADNLNEENRAKNRRVEIIFVRGKQ